MSTAPATPASVPSTVMPPSVPGSTAWNVVTIRGSPYSTPSSEESVSLIAVARLPANARTNTAALASSCGLAAKPTTETTATAAFASTFRVPRAPELAWATPSSRFSSTLRSPRSSRLEKSGTKAMLKAPSAKRRRNMLGSVKATMKAE